MKPHNLLSMLAQTVKRFPENHALIWRENGTVHTMTYRNLWNHIRDLAFGLERLGLRAGSKVALIASPHPRGLISEMAVMSLGAVSIPIDPNLPGKQIEDILQHADAEAIMVDNPEIFQQIIRFPETTRHFLLLMGQAIGERGALRFETVIQLGQTVSIELDWAYPAIQPSDWAILIYPPDSGGTMKSVILSHSNLLSNIEDLSHVIPYIDKDVVLSTLPLSNGLGRIAGQFAPLCFGATVAFAGIDEKLSQILPELHPTILLGAPFVLKEMQRFLLNEFQASTVKRYIFSKSLHISEVFHKFKDTGFHWTVPRKWRLAYVLAQTWVFSKLHRKLGGKLRLMVSDGSLSPKLSRFFVQIGLPVIETYSLPECSSAILTNRLLDPRPSALKPLPGVELRLLPDGELLVKSPSVMLGYHKQAEETQKTIVNGWLYTGEFAEIDDRGHIVVTGRKKNAIHLSDGTFVAARFVESTLTTSPYIHQAVLIGNGRPYITALIVPDTAACEAYLHESGIEAEASEWSRLPELKRLIQTEIDRLIQNFSPYAKPQKFTVLPEAFSVQKGELTSTLKLRLPRIEENHASMIEAMYQDTPLAKTDSSIEF